MEAASEICMFDRLTPDIIGMIFSYLSLRQKLRVIPAVCKSWRDVINGPYSWKEIDIEDWSSFYEPHQIEQMVEMLVTRSAGSARKLCVSHLQTERIFTLIAENAGCLQTLRLLRSNIDVSGVEQITGRLSMITSIDVSYCMTIGADALEIIGKNCEVLEVFGRNMHPSDTAELPVEDDEAFAIASTMPKLKRLEMTYNCISNDGVHQILSLCPKLEYFDMRGCWNVLLDNMFLMLNFPRLNVLGPQVFDYDWDDGSYISDISDLSSDFGSAGGDSDDERDDGNDVNDDERDDGNANGDLWDYEAVENMVQIRVYDEGNDLDDAALIWPPEGP